MENFKEKLVFGEGDNITLCEDSTTSSSSLATVCSEDDDLRLGAEANSFFSDISDDRRRNPRKQLVVMKEMYTSILGPDVQRKKEYQISSIKDLLDARDCDAEELLVNLGFAPFDSGESRRSILSRFMPDSSTSRTSLVADSNPQNTNTRTQEWLFERQGASTGVGVQNPSDNNSLNSFSSDSTLAHNNSTNKKNKSSRTQRKKLSHQSSFATIRENSLELVNNMDNEIVTSAFENVKKNVANDDSNKQSSVIKEKAADTNVSFCSKEDIENVTDTTIYNVQSTEENNLKHSTNIWQCSPWKHLKSDILREVQADSFELEETLSTDSHQSETNKNIEESLSNKQHNGTSENHQRQRRAGVIANPFSVNVETTPTSTTSDSSSGFDETCGYEHLSTANINNNSIILKPNIPITAECNVRCQTLNNLKRSNGLFKTIDSIENGFQNYCNQKSKIICAAGTSDAALKIYQNNFCGGKSGSKKDVKKNFPFQFQSMHNKSINCHCEKASVDNRGLFRCYSTNALPSISKYSLQKCQNNLNKSDTRTIPVPLLRFGSLPQLHLNKVSKTFKTNPSAIPSQYELNTTSCNTTNSLMSSITAVSTLSSNCNIKHKLSQPRNHVIKLPNYSPTQKVHNNNDYVTCSNKNGDTVYYKRRPLTRDKSFEYLTKNGEMEIKLKNYTQDKFLPLSNLKLENEIKLNKSHSEPSKKVNNIKPEKFEYSKSEDISNLKEHINIYSADEFSNTVNGYC